MNKEFFWLLCGFILFFNVASAQESCNCALTKEENKLLFLNANDSITIYRYKEKLNKKNTVGCRLKALEIEFNYAINGGDFDLANKVVKKQELYVNKTDCFKKLEYSILINKVTLFKASSNFAKLSDFAFKALRKAEELKDTGKQIEAIKDIVFLFTRIREDEKIWNYVKRAEKLIFQGSNTINDVLHYRWLAYEYEREYTVTKRISLIDSALVFIKKAKKGAKAFKMNDELTKLYRAQEAFSFHKGELKQALIYIDSAIFYGKKIKGHKNLSGLYLSKAWDHLDLGELEEANKWMDTSLFYDTKNDIGGHMMLLYEASDIYAGTGAYAKSLAHYKMHSKLKDSILNVKRLGKINELEIKYKTELKDAQIKKLVILLIFAILLIVSILFVTKVFQLKKTKQKNLELKAAYNKQVLLEKELTEVRENIAQDFHDDLGNKLARISLLSNLVSEDDSVNNLNIKSKVKQITEDANGLYTGTRDFIFSLKPNSEYLKEVITYLSDFGEDFFSKTKVNFTIKKNVNKNVKLPYYWNRQLVYIFKEALTNALKHSKGDKVVLAFNCENDVLKISCIDNGIGLKEHSLSSLNGMSNMKKRARKIGGELIVKSGKNNGTTISFMGKIKQGNTYEA